MKKNLSKFLAILLSMTLVLSTLTGVVFAATPQPLFTEDFETGTMDNWKWATANNTVGTWQVETYNGSKALNMNGGSKIGILYADVSGSEKWSDYIVEYDFTPVTAINYSGMYFRCTTSADKGYFMQFTNGKLNLHEELGSSRPQIVSADCALTLGTTYKIRIELKGTNIKVYVGDRNVIDVTDDTYSQGRIALRSQGNGLYIDNITVTPNIVLEDLEVVSSSIADGDEDVSVNSNVTFVLNRALIEGEEAEFTISDITNGIDYTSDDYTVQTSGETLTLTFNNPLEYMAQHNIKLSVDDEQIYDASFITEARYVTQTLFTEDFETGNIGNWEWATGNNTVDTWKVETFNGSQALNMNGGSKTGILYADVSGSEKWSDYIVEYDFTPVTAMSWSGMYFRCTNSADKGYFMQFMSGKLNLYKVVSGSNQQITSADCALTLGTTYKIRIELKGENIKIYVDNNKIIDVTDNTYSQGRVALRSQGNGLYVDNIKVTTKIVLEDLEIVSSSIADGDEDVSVNSNVSFVLNRALTQAEEAEFSIRDITNGIDYTSDDYTVQTNGETLTLTFNNPLEYTAQHNIKLSVNGEEIYDASFITEEHYEIETLFTEDFETGNIGNWEWATGNNTVDTWKVETFNGSQALNMNGGSKTGILYADVNGAEKWSDYIVEYDFTPVTAMSWSGMYFRCTNSADKGYFMQFMSGKLNLYKVVSGSNQQITSADCALTLGTTYKIRIELKGENIKIYVDDAKIIDVTDNTYSLGRIALRSQGNGLYVDNIKVTKKTLVLQDLKVLHSSIADGDTNVSVDPEIAITFNRELTEDEKAEFVIRDNTNDMDYTSEDYETQISEKTLTLTFPGLLAYNAQHSIKLYVNEEEIYSVTFTTEKMALTITSLAVTKADGSAIGALKDESVVKVTVNVKNTDISENAVVYVAAYANEGVMRGVGYAEATISGSNTPVTVTVNNISFKQDDTNCRLVAFVWSNDGSLTPLALTKSYSNN